MKPEQNETEASDFRVKLLTQEIKFAKMLAGNEFNTAIKEKHIQKLSTWLKNRTACSEVFTDKDCLRIWKGLFYSMWMSDKPLPQENLAKKIASLVCSFDRIDSSLQFFATFLKTMALEWNGIDQWRIDKFLMLVRKVTRETLRIIQSNQWNNDAIEKLGIKLRETILGTDHVPRGLFMHFVELFFEEVAKISKGEIEPNSVTKLLIPFMFYVASQTDYKLIQFVVRHVFNYLLFQSELGREYKEKYDAWKSMGFPGKTIDELVLEENTDEEDNDASDDDDGDIDADNTPLDPRAGRVNVVMPEIKFNPSEIVSRLEDLKYKKFTRVRNRKCIDRIVSTYKKFASGVFPIGIQKIKVDRDELGVPDVDDKAVDLLEFESDLYGKQRELKKLNKRKRKRIVNNSILYDEFQAKSNKIAKIKHDANVWKEEDNTVEETVKITPTKMNSNENGTSKKRKFPKADIPKNGNKPKSNEWNEPLRDGEVEYIIPSKKLQLNGAERVKITKDSIITQDIKPMKLMKPEKPSTQSKLNETPKKSATLEKSPSKKSETSSTPIEKLRNGSPKSTEKKVKSASKLTQSNNSTPNSGILAEKTAQLSNLTPTSAFLSAEKRVKIALKMNKSQEVTEYHRQLKQSPNLPYDSAKKPLKGVLKPNLTPSPINPFYKRLIGMK